MFLRRIVMSYLSCMGGACPNRRERCALYHATNRAHPVERLCEPGIYNRFEPVLVVPAQRVDVLQPMEVV